MKKILIFSLSFVATSVMAQYNMVTQYNQHFNFVNSKNMPSKLGMDYSSFQLNLPGPPDIYAYGGNTLIGVGTLDNVTNEEIDRLLEKARPVNVIGAGAEVDIVGFSYKLKKNDEDELVTFSFRAGDRIGANFLYSDNLLKLIWKGNKQFEGQEVELGPLAVNAAWLREYTLSAAAPLNISALPEDLKLRVGGNVKFIRGIGSVYMPKSSAKLYTAEDGRAISFESDYLLNFTSADGFNPLRATGSGIGLDLGVTGTYQDKFEGTLSILDLGAVKYKTNTYSYASQGKIVFEGVNITNILRDPQYDLDSTISDEFKGVLDSNETYKMPLAHRISLQGEYKIGGETKSKGRAYNKQTVFFTYIQGFNYVPGNSRRAFVCLGYAHSFNYVFNVGTNMQLGGYNKFGWGVFTSLRMGPIRVGIGSNQALTYLISKKNASGMDVSLNALWAF